MHECRALSPPGCLRIRLRIPRSLSLRNIGACRSSGAPNTCLVAQISSVDASACTQPAQPVDLLAKPRATGRCQARDAVLTKRRRRCACPAPILQHSGPTMRLGRPVVVGAVQVAPTPRIGPREVPRHGGSESHGASKPRPSHMKLAFVACWYGPAVCAEHSRRIWHIADGKRASGCSHTTSKHRAASAGRFTTAGEPASGMFVIKYIRDGRVPLAAAGLRLERRLRWQVRAPPW
jgi:hypothetical protein